MTCVRCGCCQAVVSLSRVTADRPGPPDLASVDPSTIAISPRPGPSVDSHLAETDRVTGFSAISCETAGSTSWDRQYLTVDEPSLTAAARDPSSTEGGDAPDTRST